MFLTSFVLAASAMVAGDPLVARDLAPFATQDAAVRNLPLPPSRTVANIAKGLAATASTPLGRARAAYVWTTSNIAYRLDGHRDVPTTLAALAGDCDAHAAVFASLCKAMNVECATVPGALRFPVAPEAAMRPYAKPLAKGQWLVAHAWNAVRIDGRWGLVDTTMGAKSPKASADDYFLPDPAVLVTDHVPEDAAMRLADAPADLAATPILRPAAWRLGLKPEDLGRVAKNDTLYARVPWRKGMRATVQTEAGSLSDRALVQPCAEGVELRLTAPREAAVVWLGLTVEDEWHPIVGYPVSGASDARLPKVMRRFYETGASLVCPFEGDLPAGKATEIRLRAPGASGVVAFQGPDVAGTFVREGDDWVLRTSPARGKSLEVMASYDNPNKFQALLTYEVR